jgi:chromosome segregation ATPase
MSPQSIEARLEKLEQRVTALERLPARIDDLTLQILQLREELHVEFSAMRSEMNAGDESIRREMHELHELTMKAIGDVHAQMLVLHENVIERIALTQEGKPRPGKRR